MFGTLSINRINQLSGEQKINTTQIVLPYVVTRDSSVWAGENIPMIAPLKVRYQLNKDQVDRNVLPAIGNSVINGYKVICGNEQSLGAGQGVYL